MWTPNDHTEQFQRGLRNYKSTKDLPLYSSLQYSGQGSLLPTVLKQDNSDLLPPVSDGGMKRYSSITPTKAVNAATSASSSGHNATAQQARGTTGGRVLKIMRDTKKITERDIELNRIYNPVSRLQEAPKLSNCI